MADHGVNHLSGIGDSKDVDAHLAELVAQIGDYMALWHLTLTYASSGSPEGVAAYEVALASYNDDMWSREIGQAAMQKSSGREMLSLLAKTSAVIATSTGRDAAEVAHVLDAALSARARRLHERLLSMTSRARSHRSNAA